MAKLRIRQSIQHIQYLYDSNTDRSVLEKLIKAWRGIQALPPYHPNSYFRIGGFHGEPFRGPGVSDTNWWGGYCNHGNVLFPTWHRAYLLRLEEALRSIEGCEDVTLPFWDETFDLDHPIPDILTSPTFPLDGGPRNPLYSYTLQKTLYENVAGNRYTKPEGYTTVRYPLSGLVGTPKEAEETKVHNAKYDDPKARNKILNDNVSAWLKGTVKITHDGGEKTMYPDTYSVAARLRLCLAAPNYTVFSNTSSQCQWITDHGSHNPDYVVSLESPHNAIHLAVGGFYHRGVYDADAILGANGDMGDNETAGFDPIFFLHHCFVDYVFWTWQKRASKTQPGSLTVIKGYHGTVVEEHDGLPYLAPGTTLDNTTPLYPFRTARDAYYTSDDVTDIEGQLGYTYARGSLDHVPEGPRSGHLGAIDAEMAAIKRVRNVSRADYPGSFVIRTYIRHPRTEEQIEIGREPVLSRRNIAACRNCQNKLDVDSLVPVYKGMLDALGVKEIPEAWAEIHTHDQLRLREPWPGSHRKPIVDDL
ncbi:hypothetical protein J3458_021199 [Metarhizium acridum]|uniref:tyrosinase n=1 Tax=Metarhizium acridum (strain CQMa 102) TaxID=655827 RepID=E9EDL0_METAQ|nr:tyrosinase, putative [Metarhizium acridum CQMa 102]EFY86006.1 tyrosinase, putative [Metarhizium acridum CQMa 102]KAG8406362.1 hypothetical protein J3458_021199 [Metarhizium acridum]